MLHAVNATAIATMTALFHFPLRDEKSHSPPTGRGRSRGRSLRSTRRVIARHLNHRAGANRHPPTAVPTKRARNVSKSSRLREAMPRWAPAYLSGAAKAQFQETVAPASTAFETRLPLDGLRDLGGQLVETDGVMPSAALPSMPLSRRMPGRSRRHTGSGESAGETSSEADSVAYAKEPAATA